MNATMAKAMLAAICLSAAVVQQPSCTERGQEAAPLRDKVGAQAQANPDIQRIISALQGRWAITVKLEPTPQMPNAGTGRSGLK